jgi:bifunctional UDP-N-acetylglucosamine pyrophosphorylase/glucosamine-1-phosphate N-acetyltransferase
VKQEKQLGSGNAVNQAASKLSNFGGPVFVFYCDTPLISVESAKRLLKNYRVRSADCALLSVNSPRPFGYGRIKRDPEGTIEKIVEENDASPEEKAITEINAGCYVFDSKKLFQALKEVRQNALKKEYYLTDAVEILAPGGKVDSVLTADTQEILGINDRLDLAKAEKIMQERILEEWLKKGVRIRDPKSTVIDADVEIGQDTVLLPHTVIEQGSVIGSGCTVGPFARIRGASRIGDGSVIGNFVEIVRSNVGRHTQIKHLSYIGDALVGSFVNIGAGSITANYDGKKKHKTIIKDKAQIGSGTILVAPVVVGRGAKTGAGAVVTKKNNVPDRAVVVGVPARRLEVRGKPAEGRVRRRNDGGRKRSG